MGKKRKKKVENDKISMKWIVVDPLDGFVRSLPENLLIALGEVEARRLMLIKEVFNHKYNPKMKNKIVKSRTWTIKKRKAKL